MNKKMEDLNRTVDRVDLTDSSRIFCQMKAGTYSQVHVDHSVNSHHKLGHKTTLDKFNGSIP
jgi:hypothetical protein